MIAKYVIALPRVAYLVILVSNVTMEIVLVKFVHYVKNVKMESAQIKFVEIVNNVILKTESVNRVINVKNVSKESAHQIKYALRVKHVILKQVTAKT